MRRPALCLLACFAAFAVGAPMACAAEIKLLTAGAMRAVVVAVLADFEKQTGHKVSLDNDTAGGLSKRIDGGEAFDVAIITPAVVDDLAKKGRIVPGSRIDLAKVGMGVAIKEGAPAPDIGTVDAFKRTLLAAKSVAYIDPKAGGSSGIYFDKLLDRLGIADQVRPKAKLKAGGYVAELVANGEAEIAIHQISEIVPVKGVTLAGPLPAEIQNSTVYAGGIGAAAKDGAAAKALLAFLAGSAIDPILKSKGMQKP
jgi:molybdate transport system substrate-binding protein